MFTKILRWLGIIHTNVDSITAPLDTIINNLVSHADASSAASAKHYDLAADHEDHAVAHAQEAKRALAVAKNITAMVAG